MSSSNLDKYLSLYAQPGARRLADQFPAELGPFGHVLVVPARRESALMLSGYEAAGRGATRGRLLVILVVNGSADQEELAVNDACFSSLDAWGAVLWRCPTGEAKLIRGAAYELLVLDCFSSQRAFGDKQGVGLARKWGCDLALGLCSRGVLRGTVLANTDADARLPGDYWETIERALSRASTKRAVAAVLPFCHVSSGSADVDMATDLYEVWLRFYVEGLNWAGSPYAFPALGSTIAIDASAYVAVRGFSQRLAGEDYYTLDKLAKLGEVVLARGNPIEISARRSQRAPFGTGPAVDRLLRDGENALTFHSAAHFGRLRDLLGELSVYAQLRNVGTLRARLASDPASLEALDALGAWTMLEDAPRHARTSAQLLRRVLGWFDGLRTLQFLRGVRERTGDGATRTEALLQAPFVPERVARAAIGEQLRWLRRRALPRTVSLDASVERLLLEFPAPQRTAE